MQLCADRVFSARLRGFTVDPRWNVAGNRVSADIRETRAFARLREFTVNVR